MGEVRVRRLDDWVVHIHRDLAQQAGQPLEAYMRDLLKQSALETQRRFAEEARRELSMARDKYGTVRSSVELLREQRDEM